MVCGSSGVATPTWMDGWPDGTGRQAGRAGRARGVQQPFLPWASARTTHGAHLPKLKFCPAFTRNFWHAWSAGAGWHGPRSVDGTRADQQRPNEAVFHQVVHLCGLSPLRMPFRLSVKYLLCWSQSSLPSRPMQKPSDLHHIIIIISGYSPLPSSFYAAPLRSYHRTAAFSSYYVATSTCSLSLSLCLSQ